MFPRPTRCIAVRPHNLLETSERKDSTSLEQQRTQHATLLRTAELQDVSVALDLNPAEYTKVCPHVASSSTRQ